MTYTARIMNPANGELIEASKATYAEAWAELKAWARLDTETPCLAVVERTKTNEKNG